MVSKSISSKENRKAGLTSGCTIFSGSSPALSLKLTVTMNKK